MEQARFSVSQAQRTGAAVQAFEAAGRNQGVSARRRSRRGPAEYRAKITAVSGSFPEWSYTVQRVTGFDSSLTGTAQWLTDGIDLPAVNQAEWAGTPPYTYGNGMLITSSSGQVNSTAALIVPLGVGAVVDMTTQADRNGGAAFRSFSVSNQKSIPCCTGCVAASVPIACPAGTAANYTVSLPASITFGSCAAPSSIYTPCGSPTANYLVTGSCTTAANVPSWSRAIHNGDCIGGWEPQGLTFVSLDDVQLINGVSNGCAAWIVLIQMVDTTGTYHITYVKKRAGATVNDVVGTYNLDAITLNGSACAGAMADASIVVAP